VILSFAAFSCNDDERSDLTLNFKLLYDGAPLVMLDDYEYPDGKTIQFTRVSFYISEVYIIRENGNDLLTDVEMINLSQTHQSNAGATAGANFVFENQKSDPIDSIQFFIGLAPTLNATEPSDYQGDHPLANSGEYWIGWDSYIFSKLEGSVDLDGDGTMETNFALHIGSDQALQSTKLNIKNPDSKVIPFELDVLKIFESADLYDIEQNPQIHSLNQIDKALFLIENLSNNLMIK